MEPHKILNSPGLRGATRVIGGIALAYVLYQVAPHFATAECSEMQNDFRQAGPLSALRLASSFFIAASLGVPSVIIAVAGGLVAGPFMGASMASFAITVSSALFWAAGRYLFKSILIHPGIDKAVTQSHSYQGMMADKSASGFHWTAYNSFSSILPFPIFALLAGQRVSHLSFQSLITGIFAGSLTLVAGYALAGASIGCSLVNFSQGLDINRYKTLMIISCVILVMIAKLQSLIESRRSV